ncbi:MAG: HAMP domain-containing sensor histidine kinase [Acidobacteriota bacterium]
MPLRSAVSHPRRLLLALLLVMLVPAGALVWLGWRLHQQDRALEGQQLRERSERVADRIVAALHQALAEEEARLAGPIPGPASRPDRGALLVVFRDRAVEVFPRNRLLYYPEPAVFPEAPASVFSSGEEIEFTRADYVRAIESFRRLAGSPDPAVRAGALLRTARNLRKAGQLEAALSSYDSLARYGTVAVGGVPADLAARRARCTVLEQLNRTDQLRGEARGLREDLLGGRWPVAGATWAQYASEVSSWLGQPVKPAPEALATASAVEWLWNRWKTGPDSEIAPAARHSLWVEGVPVTLLWRSSGERLTALVAGPRHQNQAWFDGFKPVLEAAGTRAALVGSDQRAHFGAVPANGVPRVQRAASETGLPWTIVVTNADPRAALEQFSLRRRLLLAGLAALAVLVLAGGVLIGRVVARELAVARLQSDFVSAVSHEFRTPLTSLRQFNEILADDPELPVGKRVRFYQAQTRATERLHRLVESLLDFGRMESRAKLYRFERLDAASLVREVAAEFGREAAGRGFELVSEIAAEDAPVEADAEALSRAVWNLLENAVKYSGSSRTVWLSLAREDGRIVIGVRDRGLGVPPGEQKEIFRKFVRGRDASAHSIKGTGLGLAMVRHIVEAHGGSVRLQSAPGEGSTFTILLPAKDQA